MATPIDRSLDSGAKLIEEWGQLGDTALICAFILGIGVIVAVILWMVIKFRMDKLQQKRKDERSKELRNTLNGFARKMNTSLNSAEFVDFNQAVINIQAKLSSIEDKVLGVMSTKDSLLLIRNYFYKIVFYEVRAFVHESIIENDYGSRSKYISDKIRTKIGEVLSRCRSELSNYSMSVNPSVFFKIDSSSTSERFMLADLIWNSIEEIFSSDMSKEQKLEEASLRILNTIHDYATEIYIRETEINDHD